MASKGLINILRRRIEAKSGGIAGAKMLTSVGDGRNLDCKSECVLNPPPKGRPPKSIEPSRARQIMDEVQRRKPVRQIAREYEIDRRTLTRWIDNGRLDLLAMGRDGENG